MKPSVDSLISVVALIFALSGCQAMTGHTAGKNIDDATITASVNATLVADKASNFTRIDVDTTKGVVSLNGPYKVRLNVPGPNS